MRAQPVGQLADRMDRWHTIAPALLAGRDPEILPMLHAPLRALLRKTHHGAAGFHWKDLRDAQRDGLLDGEVHGVPSTQPLDERDSDRRFRGARLPRTDSDGYAIFGDGLNLCIGFAARAVEDEHRIPDIQS